MLDGWIAGLLGWALQAGWLDYWIISVCAVKDSAKDIRKGAIDSAWTAAKEAVKHTVSTNDKV